MAANPKDDWTIGDVKKVATQEGLDFVKPSRRSHYTVCSDYLRDILTVPHDRPIKVIYIKLLVSYVKSHREAVLEKGDQK